MDVEEKAGKANGNALLLIIENKMQIRLMGR